MGTSTSYWKVWCTCASILLWGFVLHPAQSRPLHYRDIRIGEPQGFAPQGNYYPFPNYFKHLTILSSIPHSSAGTIQQGAHWQRKQTVLQTWIRPGKSQGNFLLHKGDATPFTSLGSPTSDSILRLCASIFQSARKWKHKQEDAKRSCRQGRF